MKKCWRKQEERGQEERDKGARGGGEESEGPRERGRGLKSSGKEGGLGESSEKEEEWRVDWRLERLSRGEDEDREEIRMGVGMGRRRRRRQIGKWWKGYSKDRRLRKEEGR